MKKSLIEESVIYMYYKNADSTMAKQFGQAIDDRWELFHFKLVNIEKDSIPQKGALKMYLSPNTTTMFYNNSTSTSNMQITSVSNHLDLRMCFNSTEFLFGHIIMSSDMFTSYQIPNNQNKKAEIRILNPELYGYVKNCLGEIHKKLQDEVYWKVYTEQHQVGLKRLENHVLYVPSFVFRNWDETKGQEQLEGVEHEMSEYPYPYKVVPLKELSQMILNADKDLYYLMHVNSNFRFVTVWNAYTDLMMYSTAKHGYHFGAKDVKELVKWIEENDW